MRTHYPESRHSELYRSRNGLCCGVIKGFAEYQGFSVFWTRIAFAVLTIATSIVPGLVLYFVAAMVMKPEPIMPLGNPGEQEFYASFHNSRSLALHRLQKTYQSLDRRIRRMESIVTAKDYDWDNRYSS